MIWSWLHRRPGLVDLVIAVAAWLPTVAVATHRPHPVATALLVTLGTLPLLRRRQAPLAVVAATTAVAVAIILLGSPLLPLQLGVALYTLAASSESRTMRGLGLGALPVVALALTVTNGDDEFGSTAFHVVFLAAAWLLGDAIGARRAYVREIEEKAARLERERLTESRRVIAEEQARIGRELHDVVAHALSVIVVQAAAADDVFEVEPARAREPIRSIELAARSALGDLRRVLGILQEDAKYEPQPGLGRLDALVEQVRATGLEIALEVEGAPRPLPAAVDLSAYRIVQEALTNTLKHARAAHAIVRVRYGPELGLEIRDDGDGGESNGGKGGSGLIGMRERVAVLGGSVDTGPRPGGGYLVSARIPI